MSREEHLVRASLAWAWPALEETDVEVIVRSMSVVGRSVRIDAGVLRGRLSARYRDRVFDDDVDLFIQGIATLPGETGTPDAGFPRGGKTHGDTLPGEPGTLSGETGTPDAGFPRGGKTRGGTLPGESGTGDAGWGGRRPPRPKGSGGGRRTRE